MLVQLGQRFLVQPNVVAWIFFALADLDRIRQPAEPNGTDRMKFIYADLFV